MKFVADRIDGKKSSFDLDELIILHFLKRKEQVSVPAAAKLCQRSTGHIRTVLNRMAQEGILERSGASKASAYRLALSIYRKLGEEVDYVREKGIDAVRHPEMVLQFLRKPGIEKITNSECQKLCGLDRIQAWNLLARMSRDGLLERHGERKYTCYTLPADPE